MKGLSQVSGLIGGISGMAPPAAFTGTSSMSSLFESIRVISTTHTNKFNIMKDRAGGDPGIVDIDTAIDKIADMITQVVFDGGMDMFQETMKMKLIESINDVIKNGNIIPKGDIDKKSILE